MRKFSIFLAAVALIITGCNKNPIETPENKETKIETLEPTDVTRYSATFRGVFTEFGEAEIVEYGFWFGTSARVVTGTVIKDQPFELKTTNDYNIFPDAEFQYYAYAKDSRGTYYLGEPVKFTTPPYISITVEHTNLTDRTVDIELSGDVELLNDWWVWYNISRGGAFVTDGTKVEGNGENPIKITGLIPGTNYFFGVGAIDVDGRQTYNGHHYFTTPFGAPGITQPTIDNVTWTSASVSFEVPFTGSGAITECGIQFSTDGINWTKRTVPYSTGTITHTLTGLTPGTKYYIQAYAKNTGNMETFSETEEFTTVGGDPPTLAIPAITPIKSYRVNMTGGKVIDDGQLLDITEYGFYWNTTPSLTDGFHMRITTGSKDNFEYVSYDLLAGTTYYVRSYAKNLIGTGYSEAVEITTLGIVWGEDVQDWWAPSGRRYRTVVIGSQTWMAEDLVQEIGGVDTRFFNVTTITSRAPNGGGDGSFCPVGWKVPVRSDFQDLIDETGGVANAARVLRLKNDNYPSGLNSSGMSIQSATASTMLWTSEMNYTGSPPFGAFYVSFTYNANTGAENVNINLSISGSGTNFIFPVRCVKK